ncbi:MAG: hypothetical protein FJX44_12425 [Alphaproteobacteria bacterium]|nr:hypothetical protein [Alphaproteobacteria bacterium]
MSNSALTKYDAACRALAEAKSVDEVKAIRDANDAMRAAARIAKNKQLEVDAAEIRMRAERRLGELMAAQRDAGAMSSGGRVRLCGLEKNPQSEPPTLDEAGIDKNLADRARKLAAVPEEEFEEKVSGWRGRVEQENKRVTVDLLKPGEKHVRGTFDAGENVTIAAGINAARRHYAREFIELSDPERVKEWGALHKAIEKAVES